MEILRGLLVVVEALLSLLVIGVILLQKSREQGLGLAFGANIGESIFGSRAGNVLTRATIWLASVFMANTVLLAILFAGREPGVAADSPVVKEAAATPPAAPSPADTPAVSIPVNLPPVEGQSAPSAMPPSPVPEGAPPSPAPIPATPETPAPAEAPKAETPSTTP